MFSSATRANVSSSPQYIFGGDTGETPQSIAQKRQTANMLLGRTQGAKNWGEGFNAMMSGLVSRWNNDAADKSEREAFSRSQGMRDEIAAWITGGSQPAIGGSSGLNAISGAVGPTSASNGLGAYRDAIASIESAGSGDYGAIGPTHDTLGRALGRYQVMEANIGPWSREALGYEVTPDQFLADPSIQDAIFDHRFGRYVQQYGPEGAAQAWFAGPGGVGQMGRQDSLGTSVSEYTDRFNTALGASPAAALVQTPEMTANLGAMPRSEMAVAAPNTIQPGSVSPQQAAMPLGGSQGTSQSGQLSTSSVGTQPAQAARPGTGMNQIPIELALQLAGDVWSPENRALGEMLLSQHLQQQAPHYQQQVALGNQQLERGALELEALRSPYQAAPATPEQLAAWGIVPQPGESWTIGPDGLPQQVFEPSPIDPFAGTKVINDQLVSMIEGTPEVLGDYRDPESGLTDTQLNLIWRAHEAGLSPGTPEYQSFMANGGGTTDNAREQQIARLVETGIDRNTAIGIVDGRYEIGPDETGRTRVWDLATGQTITYAQQPGGAGSPMWSPSIQQGGIPTVAPSTGAPMSVAQGSVGDLLSGPAGQTPPLPAQPNYSTVPEGTDIGAALGLEGTVTGAVNLITDYLTGNARYENQTEAANALQNLRLQTNQALLEGFAGRTNVYTQEMIDQLAVTPGMPLSAAYDRMVQTRTLIEQQIARITNEVLNQPERWTPEDVRDATTSVGGLRGLLDTYDGVIQSLDNRRGRDAGTLPPLDTFWRE